MSQPKACSRLYLQAPNCAVLLQEWNASNQGSDQLQGFPHQVPEQIPQQYYSKDRCRRKPRVRQTYFKNICQTSSS